MKILCFGRGKVTLAWQSCQQIALCLYLTQNPQTISKIFYQFYKFVISLTL